MKNKKYKAISLFAGAGGDTLGLEQAGFDVIYFSENNKNAINTHIKNFPNSKLLGENDLFDIENLSENYLKQFKGEIDLIFAGFPCQGFSHAGKKDINDERNKYFREFVRIVNIIKPRWIIGENVKGLVERKINGISFADLINKEFLKINYKMFDYQSVNLDEYGVPQSRKRVFFLGTREWDENFVFPKKHKTKKGIKQIIKHSLENAIKINLNEFEYLRNNKKITYIDLNLDNKEYFASGEPHPYLIKKIDDKEISFGVRKSPTHVQILDLNKPSKTIHGGYSFQPRLFVLLKYNADFYIRELLIDELKEIQTFTKEFTFYGSKSNQILQIGNAVPSLIVNKIAKEFIKNDIQHYKKY